MIYTLFNKFLNLFNPNFSYYTETLLSLSSLQTLYTEMHKPKKPIILLADELKLYKDIKDQTRQGNTNNITRTRCYLTFFKRNPEIHWSFLAHMVSRNAGYHMTDLKNAYISKVLNESEQSTFYSFLEICNSAIFQDAYPQLMIYEHWKLTGRNCFNILKKFNISTFMLTIWNEFIISKNKEVLTIGLIMNEQHMIHKRILNNWKNKHNIERWMFFLHDRLELSSILFPHGKRIPYSLAGLSISHFEQVNRRIEIGKKLYSILFHKKVFHTSTTFAIQHPHTGSRADYWPHIYSNQPTNKYLYSPNLKKVWENMSSPLLSKIDWFDTAAFEDMYPLLTLIHSQNFDQTKRWKVLTALLNNIIKCN